MPEHIQKAQFSTAARAEGKFWLGYQLSLQCALCHHTNIPYLNDVTKDDGFNQLGDSAAGTESAECGPGKLRTPAFLFWVFLLFFSSLSPFTFDYFFGCARQRHKKTNKLSSNLP